MPNNDPAKNIPFPRGEWNFENKAVAENFPSIAEANIPNYRAVLAKCLQVAQKSCAPDSLIVDIGCARGATLELLHRHGFRNLVGVDYSSAMLALAFPEARLIHSASYPAALEAVDLALANWTLHFVSEREAYLKDIYRSLKPGGRLVLTEKISAGPGIHGLYHDFKRSHGMTESQIREKESSLEGVLVTQPLDWYFRVLAEAGFKNISVIDAHFSFATIYAEK